MTPYAKSGSKQRASPRRRVGVLALALLVMAALAGTAAQEARAQAGGPIGGVVQNFDAGAAVVVVPGLRVTIADGMSFGIIVPPSAGSQFFTLVANTTDPQDQGTITPGLGDGAALGGHQQGRFRIDGDPNRAFTLNQIETSPCVDLENLVLSDPLDPNSPLVPATVPVILFTDLSRVEVVVGAQQSLDPTGKAIFNLGGQIKVDAGAAAIARPTPYHCQFMVSVNY